MPRSRSERRKPTHSRNHARQEIVQEAARIMAEEGVQDFHAAKLKAAQRLNLPARDLPTNVEIDAAFGQYLRLFHPEREQLQRQLAHVAASAMKLLAPFHPRLVGPILTGNVTRFTEVTLHIAAESPEEVAFFLEDKAVVYEQTEKRLRFGGDRFAVFPAYRFTDQTTVEAVVFSSETMRENPLSPIDARPLRRATLKELETLFG